MDYELHDSSLCCAWRCDCGLVQPQTQLCALLGSERKGSLVVTWLCSAEGRWAQGCFVCRLRLNHVPHRWPPKASRWAAKRERKVDDRHYYYKPLRVIGVDSVMMTWIQPAKKGWSLWSLRTKPQSCVKSQNYRSEYCLSLVDSVHIETVFTEAFDVQRRWISPYAKRVQTNLEIQNSQYYVISHTTAVTSMRKMNTTLITLTSDD